MAKTASTTPCDAIASIKGVEYPCTLLQGHKDAHENSEFEVAWAAE